MNKYTGKLLCKYFSSVKKIPNMRKYGELKFNFKNFLSDLPIHISNIKNRKSDADAESVSKFYKEYMAKVDDINLMRRQVNKMKQMTSEIGKKGGDTSSIHQLGRDIKKHNDDINKFQEDLVDIEKSLMDETLRIPNSTHPDAPVGSEENAKIVKIFGKKRKFMKKMYFFYL
jgi:seryl-tRNA synthetase